MSDGPSIMGTDGLSEARDAFQAALDGESPSTSRTRSTKEERDDEPKKAQLEDLFPKRQMDRSEEEGGEKEPPPGVPADEDDDEEGDAPDDDELEPDDEEDDEEDEREPEEAGALDLKQPIKTVIDGEEVELELGEAIRSGLREKTFHKYMSQLDMAVRQLNTERANLNGHYEAHKARVVELDTWLDELIPQPDWAELYRKDFQAATIAKVEWDNLMSKREAVKAHLATIGQQQQQDSLRHMHNFANANRAQLAAAHPEWRDEKLWKRDNDSMRRTAREVGYSDAEINTLYDARAFEVLLDASKYRRLMRTKPKPVKQGFTPDKRRNGAATPSRNVTRAFDRAERRVSRGSAKDTLAATFERILDREG